MLAGLLFAVREAEDRPGRLTATLPFAGATLIEYQARLLIAAGASQIVVVVSRLTPDLLGALSRIGRRGAALDPVRGAAEAAEKLHPLSRVLVLSDGLVTSDTVLRRLAGEGGEALLVVGEEEAGPELERIGGRFAWAGAALIDPSRVREVAAMPRDYDPQSALLHAASQAGAAHLPLPPAAVAEGHGVEHGGAALNARSRTVLSAIMSGARGWFDRWVVAPVARLALPALVARAMPPTALALGGAALGTGALALIQFDWHASGLAVALAAVILWALGGTLADLRDETRLFRTLAFSRAVLPALAIMLLAVRLSRWSGDNVEIVTGTSLVLFGAMVERGAGRERRGWWGGPGAYLVILLVAAIAGAPGPGLIAAGLYAAATLFAVIERLRRQA